MENRTREPSILVPYPGPCLSGCQDVFLYLRPETNGVLVESTILQSVKSKPVYSNNTKMVYLANIPGDFIRKNRLVEAHYKTQLHFATNGKRSFTEYMKIKFESFFQVPFEDAHVLGAFEALHKEEISAEELFSLWVNPFDFLVINGQSIKRWDNTFIINYDIPALVHKNNTETDIAVMILRTSLDQSDFLAMIDDIRAFLIEKNIIDPSKPTSRVFHFSKGPFEQILDAMGYLYTPDIKSVDLCDITYAAYLIRCGLAKAEIKSILYHPIFQFINTYGTLFEESIYTHTQSLDYKQGYEELLNACSQIITF